MFPDITRAVGSVADASRQPPALASGRPWLTAEAHRACIQNKIRQRPWCLCPHEILLQRGAHFACGATGNRASDGQERQGANTTSRLQTSVELSDESEYQQEGGQQPGQTARFGTARPFLVAAPRSSQGGFGPSFRAPDPNLLRPNAGTSEPSATGIPTVGGGGIGDTRLAANVLLPPSSGPALVPPGPPSPHSRAIGFISTLASVVAVGSYVYSLVKRKQDERNTEARPTSQLQDKAGFRPAPADPKRVGAGTGLFRPPKGPQWAPTATGSPASAPGAPATPLGPAGVAVAAAATAVAGPPGGAATTPQPTPSVAVAGPAPAPSSSAREAGWWRRLGRLYYISFGAQYGLLPRLRMDGSAAVTAAAPPSAGRSSTSSASMMWVAFEDSADAEYVANVLWEDLVETGVQPPGPRPPTMGVLSAAPMFLEDLAAMRGLRVDVVPADGLRKDMHLGGAQLEAMLAALVRGYSPDEAAALAERMLAEAALAGATAVEDDAHGADAKAASSPSAAPTVPSARSGSGGAGAAATTAQDAPAALSPGPRLPLERAVERQGVKIKLPSKFDFPGFDSSPPPQPPPPARAATQDAVGTPLAEAPAAAEAPSAVAAATAPAGLPAASGSTDAAEVPPAVRAPAGPVMPVTTTTAPPVTAPALPQVEASVVQEPVPGREEVMGDDAGFGVGRWVPYDGRVIDAEVVDVSPKAVDVSRPPPTEDSPGSLASAESVGGPESRPSASGSGGSSTAVPSSDLDEAIREYRELESLFATATGTGGAAVSATRPPPASVPLVPPVPTREPEANGAGEGLASATQDSGETHGSLQAHGSRLEAAAAAPADSSTDQQQGAEAQTEGASQPPKRKTGVEMAKEILEKRGPTDAALEAALAAIEEDQYRDDDDLLDEYYSIFNSPDQQESQPGDANRGSSANGAAAPEEPLAGVDGVSAGDVAAAVAEVQQQLASVVQAVAVAHARGLPPPVDATANMQRLQRQLQDLQDRLKATSGRVVAAASSTTAAAAAPPPPPRAAAPRQAGSLFSAPASFRTASSSSSKKDRMAPSGNNGSVASRSGGNTDSSSSSHSTSTVSGNGVSVSAPLEPAPSADPAALVTPLTPAGGTATSTATAGAQAAGVGKANARRAWGAWKTNRRIEEAEATLLKTATRATTLPPSPPDATGTRRPAAASPRPQQQALPSVGAGGAAAAAQPSPPPTEAAEKDGSKVLSKRVGTNRPPKVVEAPEARQDRVKEALRVFSEMANEPVEEEGDEDQLFGRSASLVAGGRKPWWQQRFQALFLPTVGYPDGSVGFVQVNVSLAADRRDMRVLAFEDRTDCTACLTLMAQWPEYEGTEPRMSMMPTDKLLPQLQEIYDEQTDLNSGVSRPRGLAVFRRGKLPMRPGMGPESFLQAVVYQHAAQVALARTGYGFDS